MCRECLREPTWADHVKCSRVKDHFIFSVESTGILPPEGHPTLTLTLALNLTPTLTLALTLTLTLTLTQAPNLALT